MASPRLHVFHGPDGFSAREALRSLRAGLGATDSNVVRLDGRSATLNEIASACHTATFFAEPRLVVIEALSTRFSGRRRGGARATRARDVGAPASDLDQLVQMLSTLPESTTVVLMGDEPSPGFLDAFKGIASTTFFPIKRGDEIRRWAEARARDLGAAIAPAALDRLRETVDGYHLGELAQELDKLAVYADGRRIEVRDVEEVGAGAIQHQTWDLTDAVMAGRAERALRVLQEMDEKQHPAQLLLSMIVRQYRQVILGQAMLREGFSAVQIGERLGITHQYPLGKVIDQASRSQAERLEQAYRRLLETDAAVKTGLMDVDTALELLIVELCEIAKGGQRRPQASPSGARRF